MSITQEEGDNVVELFDDGVEDNQNFMTNSPKISSNNFVQLRQ